MASSTLQNIERKMEKSAEILQMEMGSIRTGRATPALVEHIKVDYAGVPTPLKQLAGIHTPEARLLVIQPWDRSSIRDIEKAILKSDLGLTPTNDGIVIRIAVPQLTEERRLELTKAVKKRVEEGKIVIRNLRREAMEELKALEKNKEMSQDELKRTLDQLQKITDNHIVETERIGHHKEAELAEI
ncbi:MAG: ribosome recycling factor [Chloroflexi bacterium]|nr:ribosome recycling factor [Chloroflexota bacterium]